MLDEWLRNKAKWYAKEAGLEVEIAASDTIRSADIFIEQLRAQVDELWELNTADHDAIEELTACLRWAVTEHVGKKPAGTLRGQEYKRYQRCLAALELHDSISKELDLPLAEFGEE